MLAIAAMPGGTLPGRDLGEVDHRRLAGADMLAAAPIDQHPALGLLAIGRHARRAARRRRRDRRDQRQARRPSASPAGSDGRPAAPAALSLRREAQVERVRDRSAAADIMPMIWPMSGRCRRPSCPRPSRSRSRRPSSNWRSAAEVLRRRRCPDRRRPRARPRPARSLCFMRLPPFAAATIARSNPLKAANDRHQQNPKFLDHRAHRPRQVDARRPADPGDRRADRPRDERQRPGARQYGHRARARDHHQGPDRAARVEGL